MIHPDIFKNKNLTYEDINIITNDLFELDYKSLKKLFEKGYSDSIINDEFIRKNILDIP